MPPLPRGIRQVRGDNVALRKNGLVREHWVREQLMGDGEVRLVAANPFTGGKCEGSRRPSRRSEESPDPRDGYDRDDPKRLGPGGQGWPR